MATGDVVFVRKDKSHADSEDDGTTTEDDAWDDTALVAAYDRAVSLAKEEVVRRMGLGKATASGNESNTSNKPRRRRRRNKKQSELQWQVGDPCRAVYSQDGVTYEATVDCINGDGTCLITYVGYNNEEIVPLKILEPSEGEDARKAQELAAEEVDSDDMDLSNAESDEQVHVRHRPCSTQTNKMDWQSHSPRMAASNNVQPHSSRSLRMPSTAVPPMTVPPPPPPHLIGSLPDDDAEALSSMLMSWYMSGFHTGYYQGLKQARSLAYSAGNSRNSSRKK
ncbi:hypothetical protein L9F63_008593 [Diploptera punctata]|uniref:Tudor domain-containing protein n=1 Tax=Diploptera punctata TaxID=6984 RepID=A0AAD7Z5K9_DIPPU|nr:hypothetical protein L9F63_008593 [Diploptera punctata]